jgi:hypothetical protein
MSNTTSTTTPAVAQLLYGKKFLGLQEWANIMGVEATPELIAAAAIVPYSMETLVRYRDSHILAFVDSVLLPQLSVDSFRIRLRYVYPTESAEVPPCQSCQLKRGWYLITRGGANHMCDGLYGNVRNATVAEAFYALAAHHALSPRHYPLRDVAAMCSETHEADGRDVIVGLGQVFGPRYGPGSHDLWVVHPSRYNKPLPSWTMDVVKPDAAS